MKLEGTGLIARVYISESDTWEGRPLYEAIVQRLRERGIAGATVLRGIEGYGKRSVLHTTRILRLSEDLPIVVEVVDREDRLRAVLPELDSMVADGMITLQPVEVIVYRAVDLERDPLDPSGDEPA
jgi:PII-like signaling protein